VRRLALVYSLLCVVTTGAAAQSSIFGVRGLGIPQSPISVRAVGMGGSVALVDGLSSTNPAAITSVVGLTAGFNYFQDWRSTTTPGGDGSARDDGFPLITVVNRYKESPIYFSGSFGTYTDRDFGIVTTDTTQVNGLPVGYRDSLESKGGISDFRLALGYRRSRTLSLGFGFHFITGSNRITLHRTFGDTVLADVNQRSELAYNAIGLSLGAVFHPSEKLLVAAVIRHDGEMNVDRDSLQAYTLELPWSFAGSAQYRVGQKAIVNADVEYSTWSDANAEIQEAGGVGADNTLRASLGAEITTSVTSPGKFPLRVGVRTAQLPFPLAPGEQPSEFGVSTGTGLRFAKGHAALDLALERIWRKADGGFSEDAWIFSFGLVLKP
jgi:long-subunit fatty acid transport protein